MKRIYLILLTMLSISSSYAQAPHSFNNKLESVTVYSFGAELNHKVKVSIPIGTSEIILNNMANNVDESSIQIGVPADVTILSTSFSRDFLKNENKSPAYLKVEDSLLIVKRELNKVQNKRTVEENLLVLLDKNQSIDTSSPLKIVYKANVTQSTGLDWKKVKLSLSTGNRCTNLEAEPQGRSYLGDPHQLLDKISKG